MSTIRLLPDFKEFLKLINANNARYLLIGKYDVAFHGHRRTTDDIDLDDIEKSEAQLLRSPLTGSRQTADSYPGLLTYGPTG